MLPMLDFNSIKVQLKHRKGHKKLVHRLFQFHKGTIKTAYGHSVKHIFLHFNSIKVQLKLSAELARLCRYLFQFHKGTIKTL